MSKNTKELILEMKKAAPYPLKFIETNLILNALMSIKELKYPKSDILIYDMRDLDRFEHFHFCNSQRYDIGTWDETYNEGFEKVTRFKHVFMVADEDLFSSSDFENFISSLHQTHLKCNGLYFYNLDYKIVEDESLLGLLVHNQQPTKLLYYPSLVIENEHLC